MNVQVRRVYDDRATQGGFHVLVDRLWPRGVTKEKAGIDLWCKEMAPSNELRKWFHENKISRHKSFVTKYKRELRTATAVIRQVLAGHGDITLVTAVTDIEHSHTPVLKEFIESLKAKS